MLDNVELLAPVGELSRLAVALDYGADAVYLSGRRLGMRAACKNFDGDELKIAVGAAHARGKKIYVTLNIFPFDDDFEGVDEYARYLESIGIDGLIISDLGLIKRVRKTCPRLPVHVSTQANVLNAYTAEAYADMGVKRIVLGRELDLKRIKNLRARLCGEVELEAFVHGAMCISYSGRCLLSNYISGRSANRGECNQACRMLFTPQGYGEPLEFEQTESGTQVFGGNDLNMIEHLPELYDAGVTSFKIEGRVKTEYYVACIVGAYRRAIDRAHAGDFNACDLYEETLKAPNRGFNTGFYFGAPVPDTEPHKYYDFCGIVVGGDASGAVVEMRNRFKTGETLELISPDGGYYNKQIVVPEMTDESGTSIADVKVTRQRVKFNGMRLPELTILRRKQR